MIFLQKLWAKIFHKQKIEFGEFIAVDLPREYDVKAGVDPDVKTVLRLANDRQVLTTGINNEDIERLIQYLHKYQTLTEKDRNKIIAEENQSKKVKGTRIFEKDNIYGKELSVMVPNMGEDNPWLIKTVLILKIFNGSKQIELGLDKDQLFDLTEKFIHYWHILDRQARVLDDSDGDDGDDSHPHLEKISRDLDSEHQGKHNPPAKKIDDPDSDNENTCGHKTIIDPKIRIDLSYHKEYRRKQSLQNLHYFS